ncbi:Gfo/Idh/MocA family protein [Streptomyces endophyticus]|uniref:Gfo/Idh/MocA family oxidoreductase n=1 Tax=Streptomyces endophyticus TaxID=714166 RepID=A0ABU6FEI2_9ACTN|nr:Gfo/Idh/MocA family oxidoreductase [Streptomyces endophyticus]MEB8342461.1 Gfo/Idh/MocA family oxidoreductase [Streptomyces endophyticus]
MAPPAPPSPDPAAVQVRSAIVGAGMIAEVHRRSIRTAGGRLTGVLASTPERSVQVAADWSAPGRPVAAYGDFDDLLADADVDVVHICTPNRTHAAYAERALAAGKHVVCEKPLATSVADAERLERAADRAGTVAAVPFVYRYHPLVRELRDRARAGEFGNWQLLHGSYLQDWMLDPDASGWRVDPGAGGDSRAFADIGSHWCDLVEWVTGERFTELTAHRTVTVPDRPQAGGKSFTGSATSAKRTTVTTEDAAALLLRTESGALASTVVSQVSAGRKNRLWFELDGSAGSAVFDQENPDTLWLGGEDSSRILHRGAGHTTPEQRRLNVVPPGHPQGYVDCFAAFVADVYAAVTTGETPEGLPLFADGLRSARLVDAFLTSSANGAWTKVN